MSLVALQDANKQYDFKIATKKLLNHDTLLFGFELPSNEHTLGAKVGQHVFFKANIDNENVTRKYTPISLESSKGTCEFVIKV